MAAAYYQDECIVKRSANRTQKRALENLVAGQVSPREHAAHRGRFCGLGDHEGNEA
jgi:hypothetical protein